MATQVKSALARPVRSVTQGGAGWAVTEFVDAFIHHLNQQQYGILVVVLTAAFSYGQVLLENKIGLGFLRQPTENEVVVPDEH